MIAIKDYRTLEAAARNAQTTEATLIEFGVAGWIEVVSKGGRIFVSSQDEYRSRFILHLRTKLTLSDEEIGVVLANVKAPYSLEQVLAILSRIRQ
jgi:hypothetical protein